MEYEEKEILKQSLKDQLKGVQPFALDTVRWLYYGPRAGGRTHLICTAALMEVLEQGSVYLVDHSPHHPSTEYHIKGILFSIAEKVGMKIRISNHGRGALFVELERKDYKI